MVSMQPINLSYFLDSKSCLNNNDEIYEKNSVLDKLRDLSPLFIFLIKKAGLEKTLNSENFNGTIFAPCKEYCEINKKYFSQINHLQARELVLSNILIHKMTLINLNEEELIPTMYGTYINITSDGVIDYTIKIVKNDVIATNGIIHITSGFTTTILI